MSGGEGEHDLSGAWTGIFMFPRLLPPVNFEASLRDLAGRISGVTTEPGDAFDPPGSIFEAVIEGHRDGASLAFRKIYDDELRPDMVYYQGIVQPDGDEIHGEWSIPDEWSGTFVMIRADGEAATAGQEASEKV